MTVETFGDGEARTVQRAEIASIIEARMREIFEQIGEQIGRAGHGGMLPAGLVLTGGASQLAGVAELGREVLQMPVRVAAPAGVGGLTDHLLTPAFSTSIGLLRWALAGHRRGSGPSLRVGARDGGVARLREWVRGLFP